MNSCLNDELINLRVMQYIFKSPDDSGTTRANISQFTFVPAITRYTNPKLPTFGAGYYIQHNVLLMQILY